MPSFNRRGFLQLASAAGIAPLLPALPAPAVAATGKSAISKALWTSLYAQSGSASGFVNVAKGMGLSNSAIQGVSARSVGIKVAINAASPSLLQRFVADTPPSRPKQLGDALDSPRKVMQRLKKTVPSDVEKPDGVAQQGDDHPVVIKDEHAQS